MRALLTLILIATAPAAHAHPGHLADVAGHDHWTIGAAIGVIVVAGVLGVLKGKKSDETPDEDAEGEPA